MGARLARQPSPRPLPPVQQLQQALGALSHWWQATAPQLSPLALQRRRCLVAVLLGLGSWLLRPLWPFFWLPGWVVGGLLIWAALELFGLAWRPRRWR